MYIQSAQYYDAIYSFKDYEKECGQLEDIIEEHLRSGGRRLLDVACGTGGHLQFLSRQFRVEGVDVNEEFITIARERYPDLPFYCGDMRDFVAEGAYDVVTCLFSAIGYMTTLPDLNAAVAHMAGHLLPGGLLIVEPWIAPEEWRSHTVHLQTVDQPDLKIARMVTSKTEGRLSSMDMHHLVGTPEGTEHFMERHELLLATREEMKAAFIHAGLETTYDVRGLTGRGLFIGLKN